MANLKLTSLEMKRLVNDYESQLRQLQFQVEHTKNLIRDLKGSIPVMESQERAQAAQIAELTNVSVESPAAAPAKRRGRPKGKSTAPKSTKKAAPAKATDGAPAPKTRKPRKAKAPAQKGYRLSETDQLIMAALADTGRAMISNDLQEYLEGAKQAAGETVNSDDIALKISRSLQKLANRRDDLIKVPFEGRGKAYALPTWINSAGNLKNKHRRK